MFKTLAPEENKIVILVGLLFTSYLLVTLFMSNIIVPEQKSNNNYLINRYNIFNSSENFKTDENHFAKNIAIGFDLTGEK